MPVPKLNPPKYLRTRIQTDFASLAVGDYSTESLSTMSRNMLHNLVNFVPQILDNIHSFRQSFLDDTSNIRLSSENRKFTEVIARIPYISMENDRAYVPEGLKTTYLKYLSTLQSAPAICREAQTGVLPEFKRAVAKLVSAPSLGGEIDVPVIRLLRERAKLRDDYNEELNKHFDKAGQNTVVMIKNVIERNNDWTQALHLLETSSKEMMAINRGQLLKQVDEVSDLLRHVISKAKSGGYDDMSPENIMMLSEGAYQMATEIEFYAVMHYRFTVLNVAINDTKQNIINNHQI